MPVMAMTLNNNNNNSMSNVMNDDAVDDGTPNDNVQLETQCSWNTSHIKEKFTPKYRMQPKIGILLTEMQSMTTTLDGYIRFGWECFSALVWVNE